MATRKPMLALLVAAHNEELVLEGTLRSAIAAGLEPKHIYVVDDNSSDLTAAVASSVIPVSNVLRVSRSGKGLAIKKAAAEFRLSDRYRWIHIADADGRFSSDYFKVIRRSLRVKNAAATGYVSSLKGRYISQFRVFEYTIGMEVHRRIQNTFRVIPILPGPTSCFRADVFAKLNFETSTLTEDFDVTMQIYRQKLGRIQFIPDAKTYTQDPYSLRDFIKQITRWNRGILQVMLRHKVMRKTGAIDLYLKYQLLQSLLAFVNFFVWVPYATFFLYGPATIALSFLSDVVVIFALTVFSAVVVNRYDIVAAFPFIYLLRWVSLVVFIKAFFEVMILGKYRVSKGVWQNNASRRYEVADNATPS